MSGSTEYSIRRAPNLQSGLSMEGLIEAIYAELEERGFDAQNEFVTGIYTRIQQSRLIGSKDHRDSADTLDKYARELNASMDRITNQLDVE